MADRDRWNDDRDRDRERGDRSDTAWHGADRYPPNDPEQEARRGYDRDDDGRRYYGAGDYEYASAGRDDYRRPGEDHGRDYGPEPRGGAWPHYDPGRDSPAYRDRSAAYGRGEAGPSGRSAEWGGGEERSFWDRGRDEVASWFGDRGAEVRRRADGEHRGRGPRGYRRSDDRISEDVHDRLTEDSWLDATEIEVKVRDGEVTLTGRVRNREDKRRAEDIADRVSGVIHVQNNLRADDTRQTWSLSPQSSPF